MPEEIAKIQKRDGRIVDFDKAKISSAIFKALEAAGEPNFDLAKQLTEKVEEKLSQAVKPGQLLKVEQAQDAVEQVLVEQGQARVAKAYILYRQKRSEIRKQKQQILNKTEIDEVDKRFDLNALRVLCSRYLRKDNQGRVIESPKHLFERVALHTALPSVFFDSKTLRNNEAEPYPQEDFIPEETAKEQNIKIGRFVLNQFHLQGLKMVYDRFNKKGKMKVSFSQLLKMLKTGEFDQYEKEIEQYYNLMAERKFFPNTPALANFGSHLGMGSACFVLPVEDSIESIMDALRKAAIIFKSGGGVGYNFSRLRPRNDFIKTTGGKSSGPISFMSLFDKMSDVVKQGGLRRGASMGILDSDHPDVEEFITAKRGNLQLKNFNISVFINSDFWDYYENKKPYPLKNPRNGEVIKYVDPKALFDLIVYQVWESAEPGVLFDDHINQHNPFLKSLGPIRCTNPCVVGDTLVAVADSRNYVSIKKLAEEGKDVPVYCYGDGGVQIRMGRMPRKTRSNVPVWKVILDDGSHLIATKDHKFRDINNKEVQLKDLKPGMPLMPFYKFQYTATGKRTNYWGINQNNGKRARAEHRMIIEFFKGRRIKKYPLEVVHHQSDNGLDNRIENLQIMSASKHNSFHQTGERNPMRGKWWHKLSEAEKEKYRKKMSNVVSGERNGMYGRKHRPETKRLISEKQKEHFSNPENRKKLSRVISKVYREHPEIKIKLSRAKTVHPFIYSQCLTCAKEITYKEYSKRFFCCRSCASSYINRNRNTEKLRATKARKRRLLREELYGLGLKFSEENKHFPKYKEFRKFAQQYGYSGDVRSTFGGFINFKEELSLCNHKVVSVEFYGYEDVYNITVDDFHTVAYITRPNAETKFSKKPLISGIITSQCSELPLYPADSCNLGSINLWAFCRTKPTNGRDKQVEFDWQGFAETVKIATKFLDNVIEINNFPLSEIEEMSLNMRRIGLGIMGLADVLYELGIAYNSSFGLAFMEKIMEFLNHYSKIASIELAKQRGNFPFYEKSFYPQGNLPFSGGGKESGQLSLSAGSEELRLNWLEIKKAIKEHGLRNAQTTTVAPTGSISMIAGCSSGAEPNFSLVYEKRVSIGSFYYVNPVFEKAMERHGLFDEELIKQVSDRNGSIQDLNYIPPKLKKVFITAMDIKAEDHIKALATLQKWTDSSISKTINFPSTATIDDMREAFLLAHKLGCKGLTVFRDKSIQGVLQAGARERKAEKPKAEGELVSLKDVKAKGPTIYHDAAMGQAVLPNNNHSNNNNNDICPKCSTALIRTEGCKKCPKCGWGVCSG